MLEDQVAFLLQKYLGNYVRGLNKEALKISVWRGDVELTNMQLKPEALNALNLPVKVKAGFLGSVRLKVPWSKLGQEPVLVYLDRIFLLAEPATQIEGCSEYAIQEAKKSRIRELEMKLLEQQQQLKSEMNTSWLGSLISTIIGNLKLSITNVHVRYEDLESNPGHPFAAGLLLSRLSAVTIDDLGKETFATGGALEHIQKSVQLDRLSFYFDSDISPWHIEKSWTDLLPSEWNQIFEIDVCNDHSFSARPREHNYILQPVTGNAKYIKLRVDEVKKTREAAQQAIINLDDVTLCLSKDGYRDILKLGDNFAAFNQRLKYAHYHPQVPVKSDPRAWWSYAYKAITDEMKKASGKLSWEELLRYARIRKRYLSLYASLLKSDLTRLVVDNNEEIERLDRELDIGVILQWRMLAHRFVEQSVESDAYQNKKKVKQSWWSFGWNASGKGDNGLKGFTEEDLERLNKVIGYKDSSDENIVTAQESDLPQFFLEIHMKHNASKLIVDGQEYLADLSCEGLACSLITYSETKVFDFKLESYRLLSPSGLLAESAYTADSFVGVFTYKPFKAEVDWSFIAKASPCYMTYLKDSIDQIISFFKSNASVTQNLALETAAAVQMTIDGVKRTAQQQVTQALRDRSRFLIDLDISAPKVTIPTNFYPDKHHATKLLLDLGNLTLSTKDYWDSDSLEEDSRYLQFSLILKDMSAFLVDGDYDWNETFIGVSPFQAKFCNFFPVLDKCGIALKLQQIHSENLLYPSTRLAIRLPSLGFHFSPARYHRLLQVAKIFQDVDSNQDTPRPWSQADFEGWSSVLTWKGVGNREAVWQRRYLCLVGPFLYILENPNSLTYKHYISLRGKQVHQVPKEFTGDSQNLLAVYDAAQSNLKVEDVSALVLLCNSDESRKSWQNRLQAAIYRSSGSASIASFPEMTSTADSTGPKSSDSKILSNVWDMEKIFVTGVLDELRVCFSCNYENSLSFKKVLLGNENQLFEFRALGGQVELSVRDDIIYIGTLLKSLEILDQYQLAGAALPRYLARSFFKNTNDASLEYDQLKDFDNEDKFFEALDDLDDVVLTPKQESGYASEHFATHASSLPLSFFMKPPSFRQIPGLIPNIDIKTSSSNWETIDTMDSFVKAQVVMFGQDSRQYNNLDNRVVITLATLSFFCHRPTILAILGFVNAINIEENTHYPISNVDKSPSPTGITSELDPAEESGSLIQEPVAKRFLGKGKTRIVFYLSFNMSTAQIFLMNEQGISLATLSQSNLLADIKVFSASFSINASLGNLKISDDTLPWNHSYFWVCDMRNPGGRSFVELDFSSYCENDEDYNGYDYSLTGQLSEVRIVFLNRFVQEILNYFMGLVPEDSESFVKVKDHASNSEKKVLTSEIAGSPALKLNLSLTRPIIMMPRRTNSDDHLKLDALHITVQNTFRWLGDKSDTSAVHLDIMTVKVEDINLTVGTGTTSGESIIQDVKGLSVVIQRSLRDLLHQIPTTEATIKIGVLKAALSNKEYEIITECALSNISETPSKIPALEKVSGTSEKKMDSNVLLSPTVLVPESSEKEIWVTMKVCVSVDFVELSIHSGIMRDSPLAVVQAKGAWLIYKSNSCGEGFLFSTLKDFSVFDAREGIKDEFRLAIGKSWSTEGRMFNIDSGDNPKFLSSIEKSKADDLGHLPIPSMLILDATFRNTSTNISLCVQRPKLLVALDFLLAIAEFFVPSLRSLLSDEEENTPLPLINAIILDQQVYEQSSSIFSLSPQKPLIVDGEAFEHFIYDGKGGKLFLQNFDGSIVSNDATEIIIHVGNGKKLQFKNVTIVNGHHLDSCVFLGSNSCYSASEDDNVFLEREEESHHLDNKANRREDTGSSAVVAVGSTEFVIEFQAIGHELTFYNSSEEVGRSVAPATKAIHAYLDAFCRLVMKGDGLELNGNIIGLKMDSNGIRILEPFDTSVNFSNTCGKTNVHLVVSDIFMNFSFSILRIFLAVEEDILSFLRRTSQKVSVVCSQFDRVGTFQSKGSDQIYAFWRPRAPSGFAVLGDCLTPLNEPPAKGVLAVNTSFAKVKRPVSYRLIWSFSLENISSSSYDLTLISNGNENSANDTCSIWFPVAPKGYVAVGCVVSSGSEQPLLSSALCILSSLVSPCSLKDCISFQMTDMAFWRVENSFGSFLHANLSDMSVDGRAYDLRHLIFWHSDNPSDALKNLAAQNNNRVSTHGHSLERPVLTSGRLFEVVAQFKLVWWNQGTNPQKKLSIWRPVVPQGMVFLGDLAVQGYEPPNSAIVFYDTSDEAFLKCPQDFQLVGHLKKHKKIDGIHFWLPQAPPGFVSLGCIASKGSPKSEDLNSLRCIRSDMLTGDQFSENNIWDTSGMSSFTEPFSLWNVGYEVGTFIVRKGFKKPPKRFALKLAVSNMSTGSDDIVMDAEIKAFSVAIFDDYGGLMVPLFNVSLSGIGFNLHGRPDYMNSTMSFSMAAKSYNDKYDAWEPLIEPTDGFLRYQYDENTPGPTQVRMTSIKDLNLNLSVSNANMIFQAYASWNNLSLVDESYAKNEAHSTYAESSVIDIHHRRNYFIIPQNNLGRDIYIRVVETTRLSNIIKMPSGDNIRVIVPVSKNMLDSHLKGRTNRVSQSMLTVIISEAEFPARDGMASAQYTVAARLAFVPPSESPMQQQSARTCGAIPEPANTANVIVKWNEIIFFRVGIVDNYRIEFIVTDMGKGEPIGMYSAPLKQVAYEVHPSSSLDNFSYNLTWRDLFSAKRKDSHDDDHWEVHGKIKCAVLLSIQDGDNKDNNDLNYGRRVGFIQISPTREGPWTTMRLNYSSPAACWRLGNEVVASELLVKDGNRYVNIRSLVSVVNNTNASIKLRLKSKCSTENLVNLGNENEQGNNGSDHSKIHMDEIFETEKYSSSNGWVSSSYWLPSSNPNAVRSNKDKQQGSPSTRLPDGWEWVDDWQVDATSTETPDGWVYAPDIEQLRWPESLDHVNFINHARQRRWIRHRKCMFNDTDNEISVGLLEPGHTVPLPLSYLVHPVVSYVLQLKPEVSSERKEYSWSSVVENYALNENLISSEVSEICVSVLVEGDELLYCSETSGVSLDKSQGLWFCLSIKSTQIGKDIHSNPIHDWKLTISSPLTITNFLPFVSEFAVIGKVGGESTICCQGNLVPGKPVKIYNADLREPLYLSVLPHGGWDLIQEPIPISNPSKISTMMIGLRNTYSGRIVMIIIEQNLDKDNLIARAIRIYVPFWISCTRCPPLICFFVDMSTRNKRHFSIMPRSNMNTHKIHWKIADDEMTSGYTMASALNFKNLGISVSLDKSGNELLSSVKDLSPLVDMDGSVDLYAYDNDGNCMRLLVSSQPSPYEAVPTKVILVRPFMTFTNRFGRDVFIKFNMEDQPKILHASDTRVSFVYCDSGPDKIQVRLQNTSWCLPLEIVKEDTFTIALREHHGGRTYIRAEVRGYEEGSRFLVVLRMEPENGPIRLENRMADRTIQISQSGLADDDTWIQLEPLSTTNFSWDDPYGQRCIDVSIQGESLVHNIDLEEGRDSTDLKARGIKVYVEDAGDIKIVRFMNDQRKLLLGSKKMIEPHDKIKSSSSKKETQVSTSPLELTIELGIVGISLIDHQPRELLYLYMEKVFISYSTGYDTGKTNRFKLILGKLQLDNQLPLTVMPVLLAPEGMLDITHPVFKTTITISNDSSDGTQVYPYVYVRVTDRCWRINIHEPIIWALIDFYKNLHLDSFPNTSKVTLVDPEIRFDLIDVSEIKLKLSLETSPNQRPQGALGIWGPILSAVGNAFKLQLNLRKVIHRSRFMRKSSIVPSITNRIKRDLIHNPLHIIFSVDVLGMTKSTLASLSKGFAELSTDRQFLQLRSKQVWSRRITGFGDGFLQGTEAFAQGVAFGVTGVLTKPFENARQHGFLGFAHGVGQAFLGVVLQPLSGALDFVSLTVDGIGTSFAKCLDVLHNKSAARRIRNPRAIHANAIIKEYSEREAVGQMILYLGEASRVLSCTDLFKEPSKYAWSDFYEDHFIVPYQRIVLITNKRVMLLQTLSLEKLDRIPSNIVWDIPWEELLALELAKAGHHKPSHLIIHVKRFRRSESFVRVIRCNVDEGQEPQAVMICSRIRRMWKACQSNLKVLTLRVPSSKHHVQFALDEADGVDSYKFHKRPMIKPREFPSARSLSDEMRFKRHCVNFQKIWSSEQEFKSRCALFPKQIVDDGITCSIWRPFCPNGYISVGDVAHIGTHPPHVAAIFRESEGCFSLPVGYDLVWRNCADDYTSPLSIWLPRPSDGFVAIGCVAVAAFEEPPIDSAYCINAELTVGAEFEEQIVWSAPDSFPWACYIYQVRSDALQFISLRQPKEESEWRPMRVSDSQPSP